MASKLDIRSPPLLLVFPPRLLGLEVELVLGLHHLDLVHLAEGDPGVLVAGVGVAVEHLPVLHRQPHLDLHH